MCGPLKDNETRKAASGLTTLANEKQKAAKEATSKKKKPGKPALGATKSLGAGRADVGAYDEILDDSGDYDDFVSRLLFGREMSSALTALFHRRCKALSLVNTSFVPNPGAFTSALSYPSQYSFGLCLELARRSWFGELLVAFAFAGGASSDGWSRLTHCGSEALVLLAWEAEFLGVGRELEESWPNPTYVLLTGVVHGLDKVLAGNSAAVGE